MKATSAVCLWFLVLFIVEAVYGQSSNASMSMTPPAGNSPLNVLKAINAHQVVTCAGDAWTTGAGYADLVDANTGKAVGNYTFQGDGSALIGKFTLFNSQGDYLESGATASAVQGQPIAWSADTQEALLRATSHDNAGAASTVSYIHVSNVQRSSLPKQSCGQVNQKSSAKATFTADVSMWTQDPVPPTAPKQLSPSGRVVEGFYGKGDVVYKYNGSAWTETAREGKLHTLPGSPEIGQFSGATGSQRWQIFDPNGFVLYAKLSGPAMWVTKIGCPWTLSVVTSTPSSSWPVKKFNHVQTTSTRGGLPPNSTDNVLPGDEVKVEFSAMYWFYTDSRSAITTTY